LEDEEQPEKSTALTNVYTRIMAVEKRVADFEALLKEFRDRAITAFKHAGFKF